MDLEWLILGDFAQLVGNKLYLQGGGWDRLTINTGFPVNWMMGIASSFKVSWNETNQKHHAEIEVLTEDGQSLAKIDGEFEVGRPAGHPPGQDQRAQIAGNLGLKLDHPGLYGIVARLEGQEVGRTWFNVVPGPLLATQQGRHDPKEGGSS